MIPAVDVFVYDTRKDSDGGAWRKRTQNTSWYNETLGTATRGTRREFPAVAVLVLEAGKLTIYDGDNPDLPMWMVFNQNSSGSMLNSGASNSKKISALNGIFAWTADYDAHILYFLVDKKIHKQDTNTYQNNGNISQRNSDNGYTLISSSNPIVNRTTNDVAMTVLPNAPIDDSTGLPVPTIAVATNGGYSIIKDDGTVVDGISSQSNHNKVEKITFTDNNQVAYIGFDFNTQERTRFIRVDDLISADTIITTSVDESQNSNALYGNSSSGITGDVLILNIPTSNYIGESFIEGKDGNIMFGNVQNLFLINENVESPSMGCTLE